MPINCTEPYHRALWGNQVNFIMRRQKSSIPNCSDGVKNLSQRQLNLLSFRLESGI